MTTRRTKQQVFGGSSYHQRLHQQAVTRANLMREMLAAGLTFEEVGRRFNCTGGAVYRTIKRHPQE